MGIDTANNRQASTSNSVVEASARAAERDLVLAAKQGDRSAFKALAERYYPRLYRMLLGMTRDEDAAMDLTQETFVKALKSIGGFNMASSFYTWLYRIARNTALDRARRKGGSSDLREYDDRLVQRQEGASGYGVTPANPGSDPQKKVAEIEAVEKVKAAIEELKPEHREIILLREVQEMSYEEIASVLELKMGTVMSRLFAARRNLRALLSTKYGLTL